VVKRTIQVSVLTVILLAASGGVANAVSPEASCLGQIVGSEAPLEPRFIGDFVSGMAGPGFGEIVPSLAQGTSEECQ
jgi:hypothetical protein